MTTRVGEGAVPGGPEPLRLGILGAARITDLALVKPAMATGSRLVAVAARNPDRAAAFAAKHGVEKVHATYQDVIDDPDVEAVYNTLANSLHGPLDEAVLAAGNHVFTEKPSASNAAEEVGALPTAPTFSSSRGSITSGTRW